MRRLIRAPHPLSVLLCAGLLLAPGRAALAAGEGSNVPVGGRPPLSGIPLGGIGAGTLRIFDDGSLGQATFNHNWDDPLDLPDSFFAIRVDSREAPLVRALRTSGVLGFEPVSSIRYEGLFPRARLEYGALPVEVRLEAFSPLVPGDAATSGTPAAIFVFRVRNPLEHPVKVSLLAAFENVLGCGGPRRKKGVRDRTGNFADGVVRQGFAGVRLVTDRSFGDERRNHLGEYALVAQVPEGGAVSIRAYDSAGTGDALREDFAADGRLDGDTGLRGLEGKVHPGGAVCAGFEVPPRGVRECAFAFAWHLPHLVTEDGRDHPPAYARRSASAADTAAAALRRRAEWLASTREWQDLLLDSTLPAWLCRRLCDDARALFTDTVWTADGAFATLEGPGKKDGALGTLDGRLAAHALSFAFFPGLDRSELRLYATGQRADGAIPGACGNVHRGFGGSPHGDAEAPGPDPSCSFILQLEKSYRWTGDRAFLEEMLPNARRALEWLATRDRNGDGLPEGGSGDVEAERTYASTASLYLAALRAGEWIGRTVGDAALERACASRFVEARRATLAELWNGRWFSKVFDSATGTRSDACSVGQLAGEWFASLLLWDPLVPGDLLDRAVESMLRLNGRVSTGLPPAEVEPDGSPGETAAARVPDLETFLAALAIARGRANEGLDVLRAVDRAAREACPASWFTLYALAGFALDLPDGALRLAPNLPDGRTAMRLPVFTPNFVARFEAEAPGSTAAWCLRFEVLRLLGGEPLRIERIETRLPPHPEGWDPSVRVLLDDRLQEFTLRREGPRLLLRLAQPLVLGPDRRLEIHLAPPPGTIEIDAVSGEVRRHGTPVALESLERADRSARFRLRNDSTVDHLVRVRIRGWGSETAAVRPPGGLLAREDLENGVLVAVPGRVLPGREVERLRGLAGRIESALPASGESHLGLEARALLSAIRPWKEALAAADASGRLEVAVEPPAPPNAEPAAGDLAPGPPSNGDPEGRSTLRASLLGPLERAVPRARAALADAAAGTGDRALFEALNEVRVLASRLEAVEPGKPVPLELAVRNESDRRASATISLSAPAGFTVDPAGEVGTEDLPPGDEARFLFTLTPPQDASPGRRYVLEWSGRVRVADAETVRKGRFSVGRAFATSWRTIGPFESTGDAGLSTPLAPERAVDLAARYPGRGGEEVAWRPAKVNHGFVDLDATLGKPDRGIAYAVCWVRSPAERGAIFEFGSDDAAKIWLDERLVLEVGGNRGAAPGQVREAVRLKEGWNRILVKAAEAGGGFGFYLELVDPEGGSLEDLSIRDEPPAGGS